MEAGQTKSPESSRSGGDHHQPANSLTLQHMGGGLGYPLASQSPWALSRQLIIPIPCINGCTGDKRLNYLDGEPPTTASLCLSMAVKHRSSDLQGRQIRPQVTSGDLSSSDSSLEVTSGHHSSPQVTVASGHHSAPQVTSGHQPQPQHHIQL